MSNDLTSYKKVAEDILIFLVAGEASGDALGARLMRSMKAKSDKHIEFIGVGGQMMIAEGLKSIFPMEELSLMGIVEILPHIRKLRGRVLQTAAYANETHPDAIITIDSPGFAHAFIKRVTVDTKKIHYVAPSVWAWKPKRALKFKKHYDHLLALLPFEPPYFEKVGLPCHFVGHSILESGADNGDKDRFLSHIDAQEKERHLIVLPGSRKGEVARLLPEFGEAINLVSNEIDNLHVTIPALSHVKEQIASIVSNWNNCKVSIIDGHDQKLKYDAMAGAEVALATSGTVALEIAMARLPAVIAYKISPISYALIKRLVKVEFGHLLNILANKMVVPEFVQKKCIPSDIASAVINLFDKGNAEKQRESLSSLLAQLTPTSGERPSESAASVVLKIINEK